MKSRSKVAFAFVKGLITGVLMSEDSTLNYFVMWAIFVFFFFFFSFLFAFLCKTCFDKLVDCCLEDHWLLLLILLT